MSAVEPMDLSCVVVADGTASALRTSVESVLAQSLHHCEAVVVESGTAAGDARKAAAALARLHPQRVRLVTAAPGDAAAPGALRDLGLGAARGTYVTVLGRGEQLERHAGRNLVDAARRTGADLVAGRWTRLTGSGTKERGPAWQDALHARSRSVEDLAQAPELVVRDSLVTGFCLRRSVLEEHRLRHDEHLVRSDVLFGVGAATAARTIALVPNLIVTGRAAHDPVRDTAALVEASARAGDLLAVHGHDALRGARDTALLTDHVLPCAEAFLRLDRAARGRTAAALGELLRERVGPDALADLPPVERACVHLLTEGDAEGVHAAAYALARPGTVVSPLAEHEGRIHWRDAGLETPGARAALDVTGLGHQHRPFGQLKPLNRVVRCSVDHGRLVLVGRIVLPLDVLPERPELTGTLELVPRGTSGRGVRVTAEDVRYAQDAIVWRASVKLTEALGARGVGDRVWDTHLTVTAGQESVTTELFAERETVKPAGALPARPRLGPLSGDTWQPYVTAKHHLAVALLARKPAARTTQRLLHYATHFRPARQLKRAVRTLGRKRERLAARSLKARVQRDLLCRLPVRKGSVVFESHMGMCYGDSPRAIHEEILRRGLPLHCTWVYATSPDGFPADARLVRRWSWRYVWALARAEYWIDNQGFPHALDKPEHTTYLQTWHGSAYKRMGFDEARVKMQNVPQRAKLQRAVDRFDLFLVRSPRDVDTLARAYRLPEEKLLPVGYPRNDRLVATREREAAGEHVPRPPLAAALGIPDDRTVVLYAPTFRGEPGREPVRLPLDAARFAARFQDTHVLLVRGHYLQEAGLPVCPPGTMHDVSGHHDVSELLCLADVLITDYSSIMFDYALLDRPLVHFAPDLDAYAAERGSYFDLREHAGGPVVDTEDELLETIAAIEDTDASWQDARRRFAAEFGRHDQGRAARSVVDTLFVKDSGSKRSGERTGR